METVIETSGLTKIYRGKIIGIKDLSLRVHFGEIYGFLGRNGAGKTTTIRLLLALIFPNSGSAKILGFDVGTQHISLTRKIGYVPSSIRPYRNITGYEFLDYMLSYYTYKETDERKKLLEAFELSGKDLSRKIKTYSSGMARKLAIIQAFQHKPKLVVLDEPTEGLDPLMQHHFYDMLKAYKKNGGTVFISSHHLREVERVCDRAAIIRDGKMITVAKIQDLFKQNGRQIEVIFTKEIPRSKLLDNAWEITHLRGNHLKARLTGEIDSVIKLLSKFKISNISLPPLSLEDVFLRYYTDESHER